MKIINNNSMKFEISTDNLLVGVSAKSCEKNETKVPIIGCEFTSSEDGNLFISRLEELTTIVFNKISEQYGIVVLPSFIDNLFVVFNFDKSATIYINSPIIGEMQVKKDLKANQVVYRDDIANVRKLVFENIDVPDNAAVMILFSVGWRKGLFFDFLPHLNRGANREYCLNSLLGGYYSYLAFQEKFKIPDSEWQTLLRMGWFPFAFLTDELVRSLLLHNKEGWKIDDDILPKIKIKLLKELSSKIEAWSRNKILKTHVEFIKKAVEHYQKNDYISCISVLFPRIEGVMRQVQMINGRPEKAKQTDLANTVLGMDMNHNWSPLLPLKFSQYLREVYFANFDPKNINNQISRNTVGHGVASNETFDLKSSTLGFLIIDQLSYYFCDK